MTTAQPDRLDRIEAALEDLTEQAQAAASERQDLRALVESNAKAIEAAASDRAELRTHLRTAIDDLSRVAGQTIRNMQEMQSEIREMQSEVRGLQLENRRMLDHLFGQNGDGNET